MSGRANWHTSWPRSLEALIHSEIHSREQLARHVGPVGSIGLFDDHSGRISQIISSLTRFCPERTPQCRQVTFRELPQEFCRSAQES